MDFGACNLEQDFKELHFHHLESLPHDKAEVSELIGFTGKPCSGCECEGFVHHPWRHGCANCKCTPIKHEITSKNVTHPFLRMNLEECDPPQPTEYDLALEEGYAWVPRGLNAQEVDRYMSQLDKEKVPNLRSEGDSVGQEMVKYRDFQIVQQLPLQDFHFHQLKFIEKNSENVFRWLSKKRMEDVVGVGAVKAEISDHSICRGCDGGIGPGEMAIFTQRLKGEYHWHPACFKCSHDGESLVDLIYFAKDEKIYCGRHYCEQTKPRCVGCDELIIKGGYIKAMDESWHSSHFCCWDCDKNLSGEKYLPFEDHPFCELCYNKRNANVCTNCNDYIGAGFRDLMVRDNHYHEDCFTCSMCANILQNAEFSFMEDNLICHGCRGIDVEKSKFCALCNEGFKNGEKKIGVTGEYFHEWCFCCSECEQPIGSKTFVRKDERQLCNECFHSKIAKYCDKCEEVIKGPIVTLDHRFFHAPCFNCFNCKNHLGVKKEHDGSEEEDSEPTGVQFYKQNDEPYCLGCWVELFAKRCACCREPMGPNTEFVEYEDQFWHRTCFTCSACEIELAGGVKFVNRYGDRFCMDCK